MAKTAQRLYRFGRDTHISRCQRVEIMENCEEYGAGPKRKFLYFYRNVWMTWDADDAFGPLRAGKHRRHAVGLFG